MNSVIIDFLGFLLLLFISFGNLSNSTSIIDSLTSEKEL